MINALIVIEVLGAPKEHVENTLKIVLEKLKKEDGIKVLKETGYKAEPFKQLWSTFADIEIEVRDIERLIGVCFDYMPSSVEISNPSLLQIGARSINILVNDLLARLHKYDMLIKNLNAENILLKRKR